MCLYSSLTTMGTLEAILPVLLALLLALLLDPVVLAAHRVHHPRGSVAGDELDSENTNDNTKFCIITSRLQSVDSDYIFYEIEF